MEHNVAVEKLESAHDRQVVEGCLVLLERMSSNLLGSWDEEGEELLQLDPASNPPGLFQLPDTAINYARTSRTSLQSGKFHLEVLQGCPLTETPPPY